MKRLNILPDDTTYNYLIRAEAFKYNISNCEMLFKYCTEKYGANKYLYTTLMQAYVRVGNADMAYSILKEMEEKGLEPDLVTYTTLINSFRMSRQISMCWYIDRKLKKKDMQYDETYVGVMLKVHAATHDAERAVKLYRYMQYTITKEPMLETMNAYLKALGSRAEYSHLAVSSFFGWVEKGKPISYYTIAWALKAASIGANITSAIYIIKIMKLKYITPSNRIYNGLLRVYANAMQVPLLSEAHRYLIMEDSWKLLENISPVTVNILNNLLLIYAANLDEATIYGFILPLYSKHNLSFNVFTYEILVELAFKQKDFNKVMRLWNNMNEIDAPYHRNLLYKISPSFKLWSIYLYMGILQMDKNIVLLALDYFKKMKRHPKNSILKFLGNLNNLPVYIRVSLMDFQIRFGAAKIKKVKTQSEKFVNDPQNY